MDNRKAKLNLSNPKSRGNWGIRWQPDRYERIFGHSGPSGDIEAKAPKDKCQVNDFEYARKLNKVLADLREYKNPKDRAKINNEFFGRSQEQRDSVIRKEQKEKYG